jgi:hypothetical protein
MRAHNVCHQPQEAALISQQVSSLALRPKPPEWLAVKMGETAAAARRRTSGSVTSQQNDEANLVWCLPTTPNTERRPLGSVASHSAVCSYALARTHSISNAMPNACGGPGRAHCAAGRRQAVAGGGRARRLRRANRHPWRLAPSGEIRQRVQLY